MSRSRSRRSTDYEVDVEQVLLRGEGPAHPQREPLAVGAHDARRPHHVLRREPGEDRRLVEAEAREALGLELEEDLLVLRAEQVHLRDVRHLQQLGAHLLDVVAQLTLREAVGREAVDDAEGVAEVVVEERPEHAARQGVAHVADALAHVVPEVGHDRGVGRPFEVHEDARHARAGEAAQEVDVGDFLQRALEPLGHLLDLLVERRARPVGLHDHGAERERRVFVAAERRVGDGARHHGRHHQEDDERPVVQRPLGEIRAHQLPSPRMRTFWPSRRVCTPAVTTVSPGARPSATMTVSGS